jgi:hypothetical protein
MDMGRLWKSEATEDVSHFLTVHGCRPEQLDARRGVLGHFFKFSKCLEVELQ